MATSLIGSRATFAVEYSDVQHQGAARYGRCALWLAGHPIQDAGTLVCLDTVLAGLQGLARAEVAGPLPLVMPNSAQELLSMMQGQGLPNAERHFFLPLEGFDDFLKLFFKDFGLTTFLWAIHPDVAALDVYRGQSLDVRSAVVPNAEIQQVAAQMAAALTEHQGGEVKS